jgi:hypothetical protein
MLHELVSHGLPRKAEGEGDFFVNRVRLQQQSKGRDQSDSEGMTAGSALRSRRQNQQERGNDD